MSTTETFPATQEGGHALVIEFGDCELYGTCQCGEDFGIIQPNHPLDRFAGPWERHVMTVPQPLADASSHLISKDEIARIKAEFERQLADWKDTALDIATQGDQAEAERDRLAVALYRLRFDLHPLAEGTTIQSITSRCAVLSPRTEAEHQAVGHIEDILNAYADVVREALKETP